jgi:hypothetical protein
MRRRRTDVGPSFKRQDYCGYRLEADLSDAVGWRLGVFRLDMALPEPRPPGAARYVWAEVALDAARSEVDWLLAAPRAIKA